MKLTNALISAKNVSVLKNQKSILENIDIQINKKDFITIIGPNGAGKTMLLKCLMGFYKPTSGMIERKEKLKIGYMPQSINVINTMPMTVKGFITVKKKYDDVSLHKVITEVNLGEIVNKQLCVLSGGEMQRVLLARSVFNNSDLLILDEPAQNLDISGQLNFYKLIQEIYSKRDISILMISHDLHLVMVSTKKVLCLYKHICCSGAPQQIAKDPEFLSMFGKDMANMMSIYQHSHDHDHDHNYLVGEE